jgi:hypothetical protein
MIEDQYLFLMWRYLHGILGLQAMICLESHPNNLVGWGGALGAKESQNFSAVLLELQLV